MSDQQRYPSLKHRLLSGSVWAIGGRSMAVLTALASNALLARLLSPQDLGAYFLAYSIIGLGWLVGSLGLNHAVVRLVAESMGLNRPGRARRVIGRVIGLGVIGALSTGLVYLLFGDLVEEELFRAPALAAVTWLIAVWIAVVSLQGLLAEVFRGLNDIRLATVFGNFGGLLSGALLVSALALLWLLWGQATLPLVILLAVGSSCVSLLLAGWMLRHKVLTLAPQSAGDQVKFWKVLQVAWPLLATNLILFALVQADLWVVGAFRSQEEVAVYGVAARTVLLVLAPLVIANAIVPPLIAEMHAQGKMRELEHTLRTVATLAGIPAFVALMGFVLLGGPILALIFGDYYREAAPVLALLSIGQLASVWAGCCMYTLMMTGHQTTIMAITAISGAATVAAELWVVDPYGVIGVAAAAAAGLVFQNSFMLLATRYKTGIWTYIGVTEFSSLIRAFRKTRLQAEPERYEDHLS